MLKLQPLKRIKGILLGVPNEITVKGLQDGQEVGVGETALDEFLLRHDPVGVHVQRVKDVQGPLYRVLLLEEKKW